MDKHEPTLVPEWYRASSSTNSNHHSGSLCHLDEHGSGISTRKRLIPSSSDHDTLRSLSFTDRSLSSSSSNESLTNHKDRTRPYSSFCRSHRDRERDRDRDWDRDYDWRDRNRSVTVDNGLYDSLDSLAVNRDGKDALRRSHSMISGNHGESWSKRSGDSINGSISGGSLVSGISKISFERDFPSLGAEEKQGPVDTVPVSSPVFNATVQSHPIGVPVKLGANGWTSALVVPGSVGSMGPAISTAMLTAPATVQSNASSCSTSLNMAEALAQGPSKVRTEPQLSEELVRRKCAKLVPLTPSAPKALGSEKSKSKGTRAPDPAPISKAGQQSSQLVRAPVKPDSVKASSAGNFQVLNRDMNGISPRATTSSVTGRTANSFCTTPSTVNDPMQVLVNNKKKVDGKGGGLVSTLNSIEKRPQSQAQKRNEFFNSLRRKSVVNHTDATPEPIRPSTGDKSGDQKVEVGNSATLAKENLESKVFLEYAAVNGNGLHGNFDSCESPDAENEESLHSNPSIDPDKEAALLHTLGWEEDGAVEPLTEEEIVAFAEKCKQLKPSSDSGDRVSRVLRLLSSNSESEG